MTINFPKCILPLLVKRQHLTNLIYIYILYNFLYIGIKIINEKRKRKKINPPPPSFSQRIALSINNSQTNVGLINLAKCNNYIPLSFIGDVMKSQKKKINPDLLSHLTY